MTLWAGKRTVRGKKMGLSESLGSAALSGGVWQSLLASSLGDEKWLNSASDVQRPVCGSYAICRDRDRVIAGRSTDVAVAPDTSKRLPSAELS
jgi:hypothetical protein